MMRKLLAVLLALFFAACVRDKPTVQGTVAETPTGKGVYVVNEGNYGGGNASITWFDPASGAAIDDVYRDANATALGDVAQSMTYFGGKFFIVVNNSGKLVVCGGGFKKEGEIGLTGPRFMLPVSTSKAYISHLGSDRITVLDLSTLSTRTTVACPGWTERMVTQYGKVYVTNIYREYLYIIDAAADIITDSIHVGPGAGSLVIDDNENIWVLASGDITASKPGVLTRINGRSHQVELSLPFAGGGPMHICANSRGDTIYYLNSGVYRMAISDRVLPSQPFISSGTRNFYGLAVNPGDGRIYVSDALDYSQRSNVYFYNAAGQELGFFKAGVNASSFLFE
jgi:hypothetical protein